MKSLTLALTILAVIGCQTSSTRDHEAYMRRIGTDPSKFTIPRDKAGEAWKRAQTWIAMWSTMKVETSTDTLIVTGQPAEGKGFGYRVSKSDGDSGFLFSVRCLVAGEEARVAATTNACILADYIKTGDLPHADLIQR